MSPISPIVLQRRHAELGRIRLGHQTSTQSGRTRPAKLDTFRFTSPSQRYIDDLAGLYGGTAQPWDNGGMGQWEVFTEAKTIPVIAVKGGMSQWMETWIGGGVAHRCDGERQVDGTPCDPEEYVTVGRKQERLYVHRDAKPTTRLSVMLPELEAIGVWRLETHGWNAAAEIPAVAELATYVGDLVPAHLHLVERRAIRDGKTSRFVVPVLDLQIGTARLKSLVAEQSGTAPAVDQQDRAAIEAPRPDYTALVADATTPEECRDLWKRAAEAGHLDDELKAAITARVEAIKAAEVSDDPTDYDEDLEPENARAAAAKRAAAQQAEDEPVDAEVVDDTEGDSDAAKAAVWQQLLAAGGEHGMGFAEVRGHVEGHAGLPLAEVTATHLREALAMLEAGEVLSGAGA